MSSKDLWKSSKFSDCTISCGVKTYDVHKCIIYTRSPVMEAAFFGNFKRKLHTHTFTRISMSLHQALFHIDINIAADYYQIDGLLKLSKDNLRDFLSVLKQVEQLPAIIKAATKEQVDQKLQSLVVSTSVRFIEDLADNPDFALLDLPKDFRNTIFEMYTLRLVLMKSVTIKGSIELNASLKLCNRTLKNDQPKEGDRWQIKRESGISRLCIESTRLMKR
ncbi:unnamed protein product [Clonostachys rhizophaga]|uniref:BTB domain-containing protein n=1 Tax=Clonostachys rhizophaga TaxID=160324 RepID=A0A9N9YFR8_9HYPO|nr:unnamed protein product [Clonostachys rhizophaga]